MSAWMAVSREQNDHPLMLVLMNELDAGKLDRVRSLPAGPPAKDGLARIAGADGGHDDAENSYYQTGAHPTFAQIEAARRRFRGQYLRRLNVWLSTPGQADPVNADARFLAAMRHSVCAARTRTGRYARLTQRMPMDQQGFIPGVRKLGCVMRPLTQCNWSST